jgi:hypothetical protein
MALGKRDVLFWPKAVITADSCQLQLGSALRCIPPEKALAGTGFRHLARNAPKSPPSQYIQPARTGISGG